MMKRSRDSKESEQYQRFVNSAKEIGCDEDEAHFEEKLKKIVRQKPPKEPPPAPKKPKTNKPAK